MRTPAGVDTQLLAAGGRGMSGPPIKDWAITNAVFELNCIGEILQALGNSVIEDDHSPYPWMVWLGDQAKRVADELREVRLQEMEGKGRR